MTQTLRVVTMRVDHADATSAQVHCATAGRSTAVATLAVSPSATVGNCAPEDATSICEQALFVRRAHFPLLPAAASSAVSRYFLSQANITSQLPGSRADVVVATFSKPLRATAPSPVVEAPRRATVDVHDGNNVPMCFLCSTAGHIAEECPTH